MDRSRSLTLLLAAALQGCSATPPADAPPAVEPVVAEVPPAADPDEQAEGADQAAPLTAPPREEPPKAEPPKGAPGMLGTIVSRNGNDITIEAEAEPLPAVGAKGSLLKRFEQQLGPIKATGWLGIADVTVKKAFGRRLVLTMTAEKSSIVVNGEKVDHFTSGSQVKLELLP